MIVRSVVHTEINQQQLDYYIRRQTEVLQDELGEGDLDEKSKELRAKGEKKKWPVQIALYLYKESDKAEWMSLDESALCRLDEFAQCRLSGTHQSC